MSCPQCNSENYGEQTVPLNTFGGPNSSIVIGVCDDCGYQHTVDNVKVEDVALEVRDHINPPHYQCFSLFEGYAHIQEHELSVPIRIELQWLEQMCRQGRYLKNPDEFVAACELQVRKYLDRCGGKDEELQEHLKGLWYHKFMVAFIKNGKKPILVCDIDNILKG